MAKKPKRAAKQKPAKGRASPKANQAVQAPVIKGSTAIAGRALETGHILVVDDEEFSRSIITRQLVNIGHTVSFADGGRQGLAMSDREPFDVILLDLMMPDLNGFEVLARLKADSHTQNIPVIMISGNNEQEKVIQSLEIGAEDYLFKPVNALLLKVRINACIERKRAQARENFYSEQLKLEKKNSENLLLNILPLQIVDRINAGEKLIADHFDATTVLFSDLVGFTEISAQMEATELLRDLNSLFSRFDSLAKEHGVEKVKTIGDAYMLVAGIPDPMPGHMEACADMALSMIAALEETNTTLSKPFKIRIGLHTGPVVAGIIGHHKYVYDVWGATVNHASRYESYSLPGHIHISEQLARPLMDKFNCQSRGLLQMRSIGEVETFFLKGRR
ncbi:MAG: adenylate/guanylate cyclase domain-containing protein [Rhodospirillales bacterium]|jgi:class 3 adenylate cyclase|nr:adenylate/guanylate cyclase domain-containing protein [Rhodospirillales bacterium]